MNLLKNPVLRSSAVAFALTALALMISLVLGPNLEGDISLLTILLLFIVAVWLTAWYQGRAGGFTASVASAAAILYFFLWPDRGTPLSFSHVYPLLVFASMAAILTWVTASWKERRRLLAATLASLGD